MPTERNVQISRGDIGSLDEALAWIVQQYDREFTTANMLTLHIEQDLVGEDDEPTRYVWTAAISGIVEESP